MAIFEIEKMARELANEAMNTIVYEGRTLREWIEIISKEKLDYITRLEEKIAKRDELLAVMGVRIPEDGENDEGA